VPKIFQALDKMHPIYDRLYKVVMFICKVLLVIDILITVYAVLSHNIAFLPGIAWYQQVVVTLMVYMAVLSATLAIRNNSHIRMTAFDNRLPKTLVRVLDLVADAAVLTLGLVMLIYGIRVCRSPVAWAGRFDSLPALSRVWMYIPVPLAGGTMVLFELEQIYRHIKVFFTGNDLNAGGQTAAQTDDLAKGVHAQ
jgi:TRAP-type C4-dicarboxylate transport system permease small subunit